MFASIIRHLNVFLICPTCFNFLFVQNCGRSFPPIELKPNELLNEAKRIPKRTIQTTKTNYKGTLQTKYQKKPNEPKLLPKQAKRTNKRTND